MNGISENGPMRVGLNLLQARPETGGSWHAVRNLAAALGRHAGDAFRFIAYCTEKSVSLAPEESERFSVARPRVRSGWSIPARLWREHVWLTRRAAEDRIDVMHWFGNYCSPLSPVPALVMVHDLQALRSRSSLTFSQRAYVGRMMRMTAGSPRALLAPISNAVAAELADVLRVPPERRVVLEHALPERFRRVENTAAFRRKHGLPELFWVYVAHPYPHKNHRRLLEAHDLLEKTGRKPWPLVFCGRPLPAGSDRAAAEKGRVRQLTDIPDDEMPFLYSAAAGMVFPSLYEGCGLPLLEARACGCRLAVSDIAAVREFAGGGAMFFDPNDAASIAETMFTVQQHHAAGVPTHAPRSSRIERFSPENVCRKTLWAYRLAAGEGVQQALRDLQRFDRA